MTLLSQLTSSLPLEISPHIILRFTVLIGGYILLRPLIELCFRRLFATSSQHTQPEPPSSLKSLADEDLEEKEQWSWGDSAREKQAVQRRMFMEAWEAEQAARAEEEDLEDIMEFLQD